MVAWFHVLQRAGLIEKVTIQSPTHPNLGTTSWTGATAEREATTFLRRLRLQPRQTWRVPLHIWITLEDGSETRLDAELSPEQSPNLRRLVSQRLAQLTETLPPPECVEAHRVLELIEGRRLPCLRDRAVPGHLSAALQQSQPDSPIVSPLPCARCGQLVGHDFVPGVRRRRKVQRQARRHFLLDGSLCSPASDGALPQKGRTGLLQSSCLFPDVHSQSPPFRLNPVLPMIRNVQP